MSVTREEFDALVARVAALESLEERTWGMIGRLDTSLHEVHAKFDHVDERFDGVDRKLDEILRRLE